MAENSGDVSEFCHFVAGRIRLQLVNDIDKKDECLVETRLFPEIYQENCDIPTKNNVETYFW